MDRKRLLSISLLLLLVATGCEMLLGYTEPEWTSVATDKGRTFVTDGSFALEIGLAGVSDPPTTETRPWFSNALYQNSLAERRTLFTLGNITASEGNPEIVIGPGELQLEEKYISYLRGKLASGRPVGFWQFSRMEPIVIVVEDEAVGAIKPLNQR